MNRDLPIAPSMGNDAETAAFRRLQARLPDQFRRIFPDAGAPRTVVVVPSLSVDQEVMAKISGVQARWALVSSVWGGAVQAARSGTGAARASNRATGSPR